MNYVESEPNGKLDWVLEMIMAFIFGLFVGCFGTARYYQTRAPKEDYTKIDSLSQVNDSIKIKIEKLDSAKNAKVIEVQTLDNDSTLKLFYELVSE